MTNFSRDVRESIEGFEDHTGLRHCRRLPVHTFLATMMTSPAGKAMWEAAREVPDNFWTIEGSNDDGDTAIIACPCGETPKVPAGLTQSCDGEDCRRTYWYVGTRVLSFREPVEDA